MAMTPEAVIADLLFTRLQTLPEQTPPIEFAFAKDGDPDYVPTAGVTYLLPQFLPNTNRNYAIDEGATQFIGLFQVTVCFPSGRGEIKAREIAGAVVSHFAKGTRLWQDSLGVKIYERPSVAPAIEDGDRIRIPVTIPYTVSI